MEKLGKHTLGLTALFWRYLISTGLLLVFSGLLWWVCDLSIINSGFVFPAHYAANQVEATVETLSQEFDPESIPYFYRWAVFDASGELTDSGGMNHRYLKHAQAALEGTGGGGFPYSQKHRLIPLEDGRTCVLQYDYSTPYTNPALQAKLPDFQVTMILLLVGLWVLLAGLRTRHYTRLLRRDTKTITAATQAIAAQRLNEPFQGTARVRELGEALEAMDLLRENLSESLERQWAMEQQRQRELSALTHDLKTPLTIISGNGELLAEEELSEAQQGRVDAILRGAERLEDYVGRLRALSAGTGREEQKVQVSLAELFDLWRIAGEGLCAPKGIHFRTEEPPQQEISLQRESVNRAVLNLLDNAARYAGEGGEVVLSAEREDSMLVVSVRDTGPGFTQEALSCAGRGLYTSDASRPQDGHIGWGLCYARQVAQDHSGVLRLFNTEQGAVAELVLTPDVL